MHAKLLLILVVFLFSCGTKTNSELFDEYFEPYVDLVSGQEENERNKLLVEGMRSYSVQDYETAIEQLSAFSKKEPDLASPYLYKGVSHLALGNSFEAELMFDHLDNIYPNNYIDQSEWYTALCLLRSDQKDRCREQLQNIVEKKSHAYRRNAESLLLDLN